MADSTSPLPSSIAAADASPSLQQPVAEAASGPPSSPSYQQRSGSTRRNIFNIGRTLQVASRLVPGGMLGDLGDDMSIGADDDYDDNEDDCDNEDDDSLYADENAEIEDLEDGDEPISEAEDADFDHDAAQTGATAAAAGAGAALGARGMAPRRGDASAARQRFIPERPLPIQSASRVQKSSETAQRASAVKKDTQPTSISSSTQDRKNPKPADGTQVKPKVDPLAPTVAAPYGYKFVKVRKPDGTIVKVKRPLKEDEAAREAPTDATTGSNVKTSKSAEIADAGPGLTMATTQSLTSKSAATKDQVLVTEKEVSTDLERANSSPAPQASEKPHNLIHVFGWMTLLSWSMMILLPLLFLGLCVWAASESGQRVPQNGLIFLRTDALTQAQTTAVSLWPIVFAAVMATTLKAYAAFKVERGIALMHLEQLTNSNSVGGAIKQPFLLRKLNWASLILLILWCLSPLAGQGIARMMTTEPRYPPKTTSIQYFQPNKVLFNRTEFAYTDINGTQRDEAGSMERIEAIYDSLQLQPYNSQVAFQDPWGNVKIPVLYNGELANNRTDWWNTPNDTDSVMMSSLLGIPYFNPEMSSNISSLNFTIDSHYLNFSCSNFTIQNVTSPLLRTLNLTRAPGHTLFLAAENNTQLSYLVKGGQNKSSGYQSIANPGPNGVIHFGSWNPGLFIDKNSGNWSKPQVRQDGSQVPEQEQIFYSRCQYNQVAVTNYVACWGNEDQSSTTMKCRVLRQKPAAPPTSDYAPLGYWFVDSLLQGVGKGPNTTAENNLDPYYVFSDTEHYLWDPYFASEPKYFNDTLGLTGLMPDRLSRNFGLLANMLWMAGSVHQNFLGVAENSTSAPLTNITAEMIDEAFLVYVVLWPWLVTAVTCCGILIAAGIFAAILESRTIGPEFLGYANTAIKRSVKLPKNMNHLNARDRLNALQECEVLLQDVRPNAGVGRIALGVKEEGSSRLVRGREYK